MKNLWKKLKAHYAPITDMLTTFNKKAGRPLNEGEMGWARMIFNDSIDYSQVRVVTKDLDTENAFALRDNIFIPKAWESAGDISKARDFKHVAVFMHEMTHVWQYQNGMHNLGKHMGVTLQGIDAYKYDIAEGDRFEDFGLEQQASIVEDFMLAMGARANGLNENETKLYAPRHPKGGISIADILTKNGSLIKRSFV